jgi:hypothetical protein
MRLIKEPKDVDFSTKSEPWTAQELAGFRQLMEKLKAKNAAEARRNQGVKRRKQNTQ